MTDQMPEEAGNYLKAIDLQIDSITGVDKPQNDYEYALADLYVQLHEVKAEVITHPSDSSLWTSRKRRAEDDGLSLNRRLKRIRLAEPVECSTCLEFVPPDNTTSLKCCNTIYCKTCFCEWFDTALSTKQLPKCCDMGIEPKDYPATLTRSLVLQYKAVVKELEAERKLWCANMDCRAFIKIDQDASGYVQCTKCRRKTCASCAGGTSVHDGKRKTCPNYLTDEVLESTMAEYHWKRCPRCHVVVEKTEGCNNIRCTCGTMFCFICGMKKTSEAGRCACTRPR